jgi:hypothetical protein
MYFYVRPDGCDEVIRVRIDRNNDLSPTEDMQGYYVRKLARGVKCWRTVEMEFHFDSRRNLADSTINGGQLVSQEDYQAWVDSQQAVGEGES